MKKLNNKGLTLVELLAVLALLIIILLISVPTINSIIERNKNVKEQKNLEIINTAVELYITGNYLGESDSDFRKGYCTIKFSELVDARLVDEDVLPEGLNVNDTRIIYDKKSKMFMPTYADYNCRRAPSPV